MSEGSFCVVFKSNMSDEYHELLEGYLHTVPSSTGKPLMCAFCSFATVVEPFIQLRLTQLSDPGHIWSVSVPSALVLAIIDQSEAKNPIGFQAKVDQLVD